VISRLHTDITGETLPSSSVLAFVATWLLEKRGSAKATQAFYLDGVTKFLGHLDVLADDDLTMVTKENIVTFRNTLIEKLSSRQRIYPLATGFILNSIFCISIHLVSHDQPVSARLSRLLVIRCTRSSGPWGRLQWDQGRM
jgi:hypothetical protein